MLFCYIQKLYFKKNKENKSYNMGQNKNIFLELICEVLDFNGLDESYKEDSKEILKFILEMPEDEFMAFLILMHEYRSDDPIMPMYAH